ncbi:hypothetical protein BDU57DRAFT_333606 [Ampelomyces quisqualis]|uniref:Uncharacterized protein n=1 Tax=Ampelomyces quisqualis TaxID=50730 RepID=A0A6A5QEZ9_AMPQU|nr:hypothetical protein BDU57DRAFT_333606 [Ampelomyces quisqualis]
MQNADNFGGASAWRGEIQLCLPVLVGARGTFAKAVGAVLAVSNLGRPNLHLFPQRRFVDNIFAPWSQEPFHLISWNSTSYVVRFALCMLFAETDEGFERICHAPHVLDRLRLSNPPPTCCLVDLFSHGRFAITTTPINLTTIVLCGSSRRTPTSSSRNSSYGPEAAHLPPRPSQLVPELKLNLVILCRTSFRLCIICCENNECPSKPSSCLESLLHNATLPISDPCAAHLLVSSGQIEL